MEKQFALDRALWRTRTFGILFIVYSLLQAGIYTATASIVPCTTLSRVMWMAAAVEYLQTLTILIAILAIKRKNCYWCNIITLGILCLLKFVVIIVISVLGRKTTDDCFIPYSMRAVIFSSFLIEIAILVVVAFVLRRLRKSKALGLHNHTSVGSAKKFIE